MWRVVAADYVRDNTVGVLCSVAGWHEHPDHSAAARRHSSTAPPTVLLVSSAVRSLHWLLGAIMCIGYTKNIL